MKIYYDEADLPIRVGGFAFDEILHFLTLVNHALKRCSFAKLDWGRLSQQMKISEPALRQLFSHLLHCYRNNSPYLGQFVNANLDLNFYLDVKVAPDCQLQQPNVPITQLQFPVPPQRRQSLSAQERLLVFALKIHRMNFAEVRARYFADREIAYLAAQYEALKARAIQENGISAEYYYSYLKRGLSEAEICFKLEKTIVNEDVLQKLDEIVRRQQ